MKLVAIVGTNAQKSYNRMLLQFMKKHFVEQTDISICETKNIPMFNENIPEADPKEVQVLAQKIEEADGVIIGCPEHNHSIPSHLKSVIEWLSYRIHPLANKPVMIVGASYHPQGSSRAQIHLRQILDSPGVNAKALYGNEFLLGNVKQAFDEKGNLKDKPTINFLEECFRNFLNYMEQIDKPEKLLAVNTVKEELKVASKVKTRWDAEYDVVVLGFGGAGATAARFAADAGSKVLLVDSAPEGHEGGNTRYSAQLIGTGEDFDTLKTYYKELTGPLELDEEMIDTFVEGMVNTRSYVKKYLGTEPFSVKREFDRSTSSFPVDQFIYEYPEFEGVETYDYTTVHSGVFDAALWKNLRKQVLDRADKIDVWFGSPARKLIQDKETKVITGVQIEKEHVVRNIRAKNGVVLATGGFENNKQQIQDYIGAVRLAPLGSLYNKGAGIKMALEVGADLWHMTNFESLGFLHGMAFAVQEGERARLVLEYGPKLSTGSILTVGDDGYRYFNENEENRHGHIYINGQWRVPANQVHPYLIFDQTKLDEFKKDKKLPYAEFLDQAIKATTLEDLAKIIAVKPENLINTVEQFNAFAKNGQDYRFNRDSKTLRAFDKGPYYAVPLVQTMLNTQGGPRRNARAEILNTDGQPIPHLYGAGELGGISANQYQGGGNLAECLIFGKIAGENAAVIKEGNEGEEVIASTSLTSDLNKEDELTISLEKNQYLGHSDEGIGDEIVVRITVDDKKKLKDVEVIKENESSDVGIEALKKLPKEMVSKNTYEVDAIAGASASSRALKSAVKDALSQI